jgi:hypothetical protein
MIGIYFGDKNLVTTSYAEDGVFFVLFLFALALFIFKEKAGKYVLSGWLFCWLATQFYSHWWFTITGNGAEKISYFKDSIKLFNSNTVYIPDIYHIVLHLLILLSLIFTIVYCVSAKKHIKTSEYKVQI